MKKAVIFHGTGSSPDSFWIPYVKSQLIERGFEVTVPALPNSDEPNLAEWLELALGLDYDEQSVVVGHSSGCALILALLERIGTPVAQAILVSGFAQPLGKGPNPMLEETYDWDYLSDRARWTFINSDDDPWGCDDKAGRYMFDRLGGDLIVRHGQGHMGSDAFNQPYTEFPLVVQLVD